jgi:hypothetical protein
MFKCGLQSSAIALLVAASSFSGGVKAQESSTGKQMPPIYGVVTNPSIPMGCSYVIDDWRDGVIGWLDVDSNVLRVAIDGELRAFSFRGFQGDVLLGETDAYKVRVTPIKVLMKGYEYSETKETLHIINKESGLQSRLIVRVKQVC